MFDVVLYQPEIPPNTGNVIRLCANAGCRLHLIHPLGFRMETRLLRRAGLDYHELTSVTEHADWQSYLGQRGDAPIWAYSTKASRRYDRARIGRGDTLLFGPETRGLPDSILAEHVDRLLRLPMRAGNRSLNLSNTVAVAVYEAWRQLDFAD